MRFWIHLFALGFAMGIVTGVVLSYEIGTNWSVFAERTGNVIGPYFTYEVLMAFFLEAGFIGIMLFGMERVGERLHFIACSMVALGAMFSAFWILAANSWMQTPAGFTIGPDGKFEVTSWWMALFSPLMPYRLAHMVTAAYITASRRDRRLRLLSLAPAAHRVRQGGLLRRDVDGAGADPFATRAWRLAWTGYP